MYMCLCIYIHIYSIRLIEDEYKSFKNENSNNSTELLKYLWSLRKLTRYH